MHRPVEEFVLPGGVRVRGYLDALNYRPEYGVADPVTGKPAVIHRAYLRIVEVLDAGDSSHIVIFEHAATATGPTTPAPDDLPGTRPDGRL